MNGEGNLTEILTASFFGEFGSSEKYNTDVILCILCRMSSTNETELSK